jgi:hypothetical protein
MAVYEEVSAEILALATELVETFHPDLQNARIAFVQRSDAPVSNGRITYGKACKIADQLKVHFPYDFLIWISKRAVKDLEPLQIRALLDHELYHCTMKQGQPAMRPHDIEEFTIVIDRYGLWNTCLQNARETFDKAVQLNLLQVEKVGKPILETMQAVPVGADGGWSPEIKGEE